MAQPIGKQLREARVAQGLTIEDVEHHTRIRRALLAAMESDDYSPFGNLTYTSHFLDLYSRHLKVNIDETLARLDKGALSPVAEYRYLQPSVDRIGPAASGRRPVPGRIPSIVAFASFLAVLVVGVGAAMAYGRWTLSRRDATPSDQPAPSNVGTGGPATPVSPPASAASPASGPTTAPDQPPARQLGGPVLPVLRAAPVDDEEATGASPSKARPIPPPGDAVPRN